MYFLFGIFILLAILGVLTPYFTRKTVVFGVTIPEQFLHDERLKKFNRNYSVILASIAMVLGVTNSIIPMLFSISEMTFVFISLVIIYIMHALSFALYFVYHVKTKQLRQREGWDEKVRQVYVMDLSLRERDESLPIAFFGIPIVITLALITYTYMYYNAIPDVFPSHWGPSGEPDAWTEKSLLSVVMLPLILLGTQVFMLVLAIGMKKSRMKLSVNEKEQSSKRELGFRKYSSWYFALTIYTVTALMGFLHYTTMIQQNSDITAFLILFVAFNMLTLGGLIPYVLKVRSMNEKFETIHSNETVADDDKYWKCGIFYINKEDTSFLVEKRFGTGWTLNFGNKWSYAVLLLTLLPLIIVFII